MPIVRKPKTPSQSTSAVDVDALINRGGSVATQLPPETNTPQKENTTATVNLRIPTHLLSRIDQSLESRPIKTPRHTWILEALHEKLEREGQGS